MKNLIKSLVIGLLLVTCNSISAQDSLNMDSLVKSWLYEVPQLDTLDFYDPLSLPPDTIVGPCLIKRFNKIHKGVYMIIYSIKGVETQLWIDDKRITPKWVEFVKPIRITEL